MKCSLLVMTSYEKSKFNRIHHFAILSYYLHINVEFILLPQNHQPQTEKSVCSHRRISTFATHNDTQIPFRSVWPQPAHISSAFYTFFYVCSLFACRFRLSRMRIHARRWMRSTSIVFGVVDVVVVSVDQSCAFLPK